MKDGAIVQVGTPEALVLGPADDYVAAFTRAIPRAKVLTAGGVMRRVVPQEGFAGQVPATARIGDIADRVEAAGAPHAVVDAGGAIVGAIDRRIVVDVLVGRSTGGAGA
jgi:glycine betaine/proline transport system ATP-binding protein